MSKQSNNLAMPSSFFEMLDQKLFKAQSIRDTLSDLEKMKDIVMCHEDTETKSERESFTMSFQIMHKTLTCIQMQSDPDDIYYGHFTYTL